MGLVVDRIELVRSLAERVVRSHGLEIFDVQFRRESAGWVLRVVIDRPDIRAGQTHAGRAIAGVSVADCQRVSEELGALLDVEDVIDRAYTLEVSSPGLDRPLRGLEDFQRFAGSLAKVVVMEPVNGQMHFEGRVEQIEGDEVIMRLGKSRTVRIPIALVKRANLEVEF